MGVPLSLPSRLFLPGRSCLDHVHLYAHVRMCACEISAVPPGYITPRGSFSKKNAPGGRAFAK